MHNAVDELGLTTTLDCLHDPHTFYFAAFHQRSEHSTRGKIKFRHFFIGKNTMVVLLVPNKNIKVYLISLEKILIKTTKFVFRNKT